MSLWDNDFCTTMPLAHHELTRGWKFRQNGTDEWFPVPRRKYTQTCREKGTVPLVRALMRTQARAQEGVVIFRLILIAFIGAHNV